MTETRDFDLADILSITTGRLLSHRHIDGVYEILSHLTGENLMTHQLPRAAEAARPALLEQHPSLAGVQPPDGLSIDALREWIARTEESYGYRLPVTPLDSWQRRNPLVELAEKMGGRPVVAVVTDQDGAGA